jgi:plastocyanin
MRGRDTIQDSRLLTRRAVLASLALPVLAASRLNGQVGPARVKIALDYGLGLWYFDPVGLFIEKGQTVEWTASRWGATVSAFHPSNDNQELRIPEGAKPFDSPLLAQADTFRWTFDAEGTYDYFSRNHLTQGTIGRIVVGRPGGPGEKQPRYGGAEGRAPVYSRAMRVFEVLDSKEIVERKAIPFPTAKLGRRFPEH